jgi:uncharacterized caspase-like protein
MRRALVVGIDNYPTAPLSGCVKDANVIRDLLAKNEDGSPNFDCRLITAPNEKVSRALLKKHVESLFQDEADVALFYFSGHGTANNLGGYLVTQDAERYDAGVAMQDVLALANQATRIKEVVVLLDCCFSGAFGQLPVINNDSALLREGLTILTASRSDQVSMEAGGAGVFTSLVSGALSGGASDVLGKVTIAAVYAYVDQALGPWDQRPLFKSHVSKLISLRNCRPIVPLEKLRMLPKYFPTPDHEFRLDPSFEPYKNDPAYAHEALPRSVKNEEVFRDLQNYRAAHLLVPLGEEHMYYAAMNRKSCTLTPLGRFYWLLANEGKI